MNSISKLLVNRYWFRLLLSICLSVTATLFGVNGNFFWMGLSIGALVISIWWQLRLYRHHTRQVLFMIDALENNDNAFHFPEDQDTIENRQINEALHLLGLNIFTHIRQLSRIDTGLMELISSCQAGDKLQTTFTNERETINLSIRVSDITVRKEHLRILALNDIHTELDEKEIDSWIRLTRVLTHEIMNSVTPITSLSDTLLSLSNTKDEEIRNGLQTISATGKGLLSFVESYRRFTRIPSPEPSLFYVKAFIERMVELGKHQNPDGNITFQINISPADLILYADEKLISQVVINLLKNAIQAIGNQPDGCISIHAYCNESEEIMIEISNNGPVIPPEVAEHIFIPFFTTKEGGSGIGLSISRQIMRLSGGSITLFPGKETKFVLKFK